MRKNAWSAAIMLSMLTACLSSGTKGQDPYMRDVPLPRSALELKLEESFPEFTDEIKGPFLNQPSSLCVVSSGNLFIADARGNEVIVLSPEGKLLFTFGGAGQGPGEFMYPAEIVTHDRGVAVREAQNMRIQFFDLSGRYMAGFKIFRTYTSIALADNRVYAAPMPIPFHVSADRGLLIDVLDYDGRLLRSFGDVLDIGRSDLAHWLNLALLGAGADGDLWVAFRCFPVVRKYSLEGKLLAEYRYDHELAKRKEAYNAEVALSDDGKKRQPPFQWLVRAVFAAREGLYIIDSTAGNRLLISLMRPDGKIEKHYWAPIENKGFSCPGLIAVDDPPHKKFYVLNSEDARVEVYRARN